VDATSVVGVVDGIGADCTEATAEVVVEVGRYAATCFTETPRRDAIAEVESPW